MGTIRNIWLLAEEKQKYLPSINLVGVALNIVLNALLIPTWGARGAAFASLVTQVAMNFAFGFVFRPIVRNNILMMRGINPKKFAGEIKLLVKEMRKKDE